MMSNNIRSTSASPSESPSASPSVNRNVSPHWTPNALRQPSPMRRPSSSRGRSPGIVIASVSRSSRSTLNRPSMSRPFPKALLSSSIMAGNGVKNDSGVKENENHTVILDSKESSVGSSRIFFDDRKNVNTTTSSSSTSNSIEDVGRKSHKQKIDNFLGLSSESEEDYSSEGCMTMMTQAIDRILPEDSPTTTTLPAKQCETKLQQPQLDIDSSNTDKEVIQEIKVQEEEVREDVEIEAVDVAVVTPPVMDTPKSSPNTNTNSDHIKRTTKACSEQFYLIEKQITELNKVIDQFESTMILENDAKNQLVPFFSTTTDSQEDTGDYRDDVSSPREITLSSSMPHPSKQHQFITLLKQHTHDLLNSFTTLELTTLTSDTNVSENNYHVLQENNHSPTHTKPIHISTSRRCNTTNDTTIESQLELLENNSLSSIIARMQRGKLLS